MPLSTTDAIAFPITPRDNHYLLVWIERSNYDTSRYHIQRNETEVKASYTSQMLFEKMILRNLLPSDVRTVLPHWCLFSMIARVKTLSF